MDPSCNCGGRGGHETSASAPEQQSPATSSGQPCKHCASLAPTDCANLTTGAVSTPCQHRHLVPGPGPSAVLRPLRLALYATGCTFLQRQLFLQAVAILWLFQRKQTTIIIILNNVSWSILISCRDADQTESLEQENDPCPISSSSACSL